MAVLSELSPEVRALLALKEVDPERYGLALSLLVFGLPDSLVEEERGKDEVLIGGGASGAVGGLPNHWRNNWRLSTPIGGDRLAKLDEHRTSHVGVSRDEESSLTLAMLHELTRSRFEFPELVRGMDHRSWAVQVVVQSNRKGIFVMDDPDSIKRDEAHVMGGRVVFLDQQVRWNSISGAVKEDELIERAVWREMGEELIDGRSWEGEMEVFEDLPVMACYQEERDSGTAWMMAGLLVVYTVTDEEELLLERKGRFIEREEAFRLANDNREAPQFRPVFRAALQVLSQLEGGVDEEVVVWQMALRNWQMLKAARERGNGGETSLDMGVFALLRSEHEE